MEEPKSLESLERELNAAIKTINKLLKDLSNKNQEIASLQDMLKRAPLPIIQPKQLAKPLPPAEEEIAAMQLERLRIVAAERTLTLEETRMFDLLVKNKRLGQDQSTINLSKGQYRDITEADLLQIAATSVPDEQDNS